jgi:CheY-like chemotaxis protein
MSKILILEDEPSILKLMAVILGPLDHRLLKASTVDEAFQRWEGDGGIDLLIADVNLPGGSGLRVALNLRSLLPNLKIIVTSGHTPDMWAAQELAELYELPPDSVAVLQKPFVPAALLNAVRQFTETVSQPASALIKAALGQPAVGPFIAQMYAAE